MSGRTRLIPLRRGDGMRLPWDAEIELTAKDATLLIEEQFPGLATGGARLLGRGWDNTAFVTGDNVVFRFPRKAAAATLLETESRVLPALAAAGLPLSVPSPLWHGRPGERFPWPFVGYPRLAGTPATEARLTRREREDAAPRLGRFLRKLHDLDPAAFGVPGDVLDRRNFQRRLPLITARFDQLRRNSIVSDPSPWLALFDSLADSGSCTQNSLVHGDLYARHLLVDGDRRLSGIIDWGDVHAGDIAMDLMLTWGFLPPTARAAFFREYGTVSEEALRTARLRAAFHAVSIAWYGLELREPELVDEGRVALDFVLEE